MTHETNDGGPAFPHPNCTFVDPHDSGIRETVVRDHRGMSLRDWFAGQALAGNLDEMISMIDEPGAIAIMAYAIADAMIEARKG